MPSNLQCSIAFYIYTEAASILSILIQHNNDPDHFTVSSTGRPTARFTSFFTSSPESPLPSFPLVLPLYCVFPPGPSTSLARFSNASTSKPATFGAAAWLSAAYSGEANRTSMCKSTSVLGSLGGLYSPSPGIESVTPFGGFPSFCVGGGL